MLSLVTTVAAAAATLLAVAWGLQRRLIYFPSGTELPPAPQVLPGARDVAFATADGLRLGGWLVPPATGTGALGVVVFNGNAGSRLDRAPLAAALAERGAWVLLFDYRGYAGNPGHPSEAGLAADGGAAVSFLAGQPGVEPDRIVYYGESLGTAVAAAVAVRRPPAGLVLRSPFPSLAAVGRLHYPFLPVALLLRDRYPAARQLSGVRCPVLVLAGERDALVPPRLSRDLYDAASGPKRFVTVPGADHNDPALLDGALLVREVSSFLRQVGASQPP